MECFTVSSPGKTILFGEHAVVHGVPAIAASVAMHTYITVEPADHAVELDFPDVQLSVRWSADFFEHSTGSTQPETNFSEIPQTLNHALHARAETLARKAGDLAPVSHAAAVAFLYLYMSVFPSGGPNLRFKTLSTLPIGAGLGSSASFSACLAAALLRAAGILNEKSDHEEAMAFVTKYSFLGECCIHGNPSGIDNVVATRGGAVFFQRSVSGGPPLIKPYAEFPELQLVLTDTGVPRMTSELVARVTKLKHRWPTIFEPLMSAFAEIVTQADLLLTTAPDAATFATKLGELAELNHGLLATLAVSHPSLERVRDVCKDLNLGSTKLTGAGGGGCAITIAAPKTQEEGIEQFREMLGPQYRVFATKLGVKGVGYACGGCSTASELSRLDWQYW